MEMSVIIAGFGGQGVMLTGKLLGYAATDHDKKAVFLPQYGTQQRGGTASCFLRISDTKVGCPIIGKTDIAILFNQPSMDAFAFRVKPGGILFANSTLCRMPDRDDITLYELPVDEESISRGWHQAANIIMLGAFLEVTKLFTIEEMTETMNHVMSAKPEMIPVNEMALMRGAEMIRQKEHR